MGLLKDSCSALYADNSLLIYSPLNKVGVLVNSQLSLLVVGSGHGGQLFGSSIT